MNAQAQHTEAIRVDHATRLYPQGRGEPPLTALDNVSLTISTGEFVAILGPNGSGKSTLLRLIATLDLPTEGTVSLLGHSTAKSIARVRAQLGVLFQSPSIDTLLTVRENLAVHAALFGMRKDDSKDAIESAARTANIHDRLDTRAGELSGGLLRRADLARALLHEPSVLILDEPTTGLDPTARRAFLDSISTMHREKGAAIVMSTHLMDEAERADRVVLLANGKIVGDGTQQQLLASLDAPLIIETDEVNADKLTNAGLNPTVTNGRARAGADEQTAKDLAATLMAHGAPVRVGPPTLDDVYEKLTGAILDRAHTSDDGAPS